MATGHTSVRAHGVHAHLSWALRWVRALVYVCADSIDGGISLGAGHTAVGAFRVHTPLSRAGLSLLALVYVDALSVDESVTMTTGDTSVGAGRVHAHLSGTLRGLGALVHVCAAVVLELVTMATDAAVTSWCVLTAAVGTGCLATLVNVCTLAVQQSKSRATGHAAERSHRVDTLLTRTQQRILTLVHVCAGVPSELVTAVTNALEASCRVLTASVGATGAERTVVCVADCRGPSGGGGRTLRCCCCCDGAFGRRGNRAPGAGQSDFSNRWLKSRRRVTASLVWSRSWFGLSRY